MSISKGLHLAFDRLAAVGGEALQVFTANQRQWNPKVPDEGDIAAFKESWSKIPGVPGGFP